MQNKILVLVYVPMLETEYDILIPINKQIGTVKNNILNAIKELSEYDLSKKGNVHLYDKISGKMYDDNIYVKHSGIINGTKLIIN